MANFLELYDEESSDAVVHERDSFSSSELSSSAFTRTDFLFIYFVHELFVNSALVAIQSSYWFFPPGSRAHRASF